MDGNTVEIDLKLRVEIPRQAHDHVQAALQSVLEQLQKETIFNIEVREASGQLLDVLPD